MVWVLDRLFRCGRKTRRRASEVVMRLFDRLITPGILCRVKEILLLGMNLMRYFIFNRILGAKIRFQALKLFW